MQSGPRPALHACLRPRCAGNPGLVQLLESALGAVSLFAHLRPDEIGRIATRFECRDLVPGLPEPLVHGSDSRGHHPPQFILVLSGVVELSVEDPLGDLHARMRPGDRYGMAMLLTGHTRQVSIRPLRRCKVATLDRPGLEAILREFPAVSLGLVAELATDLRKRNDQIRRVLELQTAGLPLARVERELAHVRRALSLRASGVRHASASGLFRRWVVEKGTEPPFWILVGFGLGLVGSRITVHLILKYHLEKHFFALVAGSDPNPVHIHHFNYGLLLVGVTGLVSLSPWGRRAQRTLALLFGFGCALVFDEFALFWNLNPDYSQGLSLISAGIAAVILLQLAYFRRFWAAAFLRMAQWLGSE